MTYIDELKEYVTKKDPNEPEFHQAVDEVLDSIGPVMERHPEYRKAKIVERIVELPLTAESRAQMQKTAGAIQADVETLRDMGLL